jgi:trimeric autotransporter adhesin
MNRSPLRAFLLIPFVLACFALSPSARAVCQEGCLSGDNTALGEDALGSLTSGDTNTAAGFQALMNDTTGSQNTAAGWQALFGNRTGINNTAVGFWSLSSNRDGSDNTAVGAWALTYGGTGGNNTAVGEAAMEFGSGDDNTALGWGSLLFNGNGSRNTVAGSGAMRNNSTGSNNTALGASALTNNTSGDANIAIGFSAGMNLTTGSDNIDIGNSGFAVDSNTIRIGSRGIQRKTFIAGISGVAVTGSQVVISSDGKLGVTASSARFKDQIKPMDKASEAILALKPVTFRYHHDLDPDGIRQFGLVAEEVEKVSPDLVARDDQGKAYSVRYEAVNAMLLNEFLKERRKVEEQDRKIQEQEATITQLKKEMKTVVARLEEQAAQIQKVNAHLELNKTASQIVLNNQ